VRENKLQSDCLKWLEEHHPYDVLPANIHGGGWTNKGFPDVICCIKGKYVAFELKVGENQMDGAQRLWRKRILRSGGQHHCPRTLEAFKEIIERNLADGDLSPQAAENR